MRKFSLFLIVLTLSVVFGQSTISKAQEYYYSAEKAYRAQDFRTALLYYELALKEDSRIETDDVMIKYKMGIAAFMIGDYVKAKSYLAPYKGNPNVDGLLRSIEDRTKQDEWKKWLMREVLTSATEMTVPQQTQSSGRQFNVFLFVIILFVITFLVMIFMEYRVFKAKTKIQTVVLKSPEEVKESSSAVITSPVAAEEETINLEELLPSNSKIIDIEELLNQEIDIFKELLEGEVNTKSLEEEIAKSKKSSEEVLNETENILNEIFGHVEEVNEQVTENTKESLENVVKTEKLTVESTFVESTLLEMINKLNEYQENYKIKETEFKSIEEIEKLSSELKDFDDKESLTDEDTNLIVEILKRKLSEKLEEANANT